MKKPILIGVLFLAFVLIASPVSAALEKETTARREQAEANAAKSISADNNLYVWWRGHCDAIEKSAAGDGFVRGDSFFDIFTEIDITEKAAVADGKHKGPVNWINPPEKKAFVTGKHDMVMAAVRNIKMAIADNEPGDNVGCLIRGISKDDLRMLQGKSIAGKVLVEPHPAESKKSLMDDDETYDHEVWNQPIKWKGWDLDGKGTDNVVEKIELAVERREVFRIEYGHPDFFWLPTPYGK